jgi:hypothetical protein
VLDLATQGPLPTVASQSEADDAGLRTGAVAEPVIDDTARAQYKHRISELESEIEDARQRGHDEAAAAAREELDALIEALASAYGLGGRVRRTTDDGERARKAVTRRVRDAMSRIDRAHPLLGRHLQASIHTGMYCRYAPDRVMEWTVQSA